MTANYLDAIRGFEGFTPKADWDYAQYTNGYGTKAKFAGEVIDKTEADRRFNSEIAEARAIVERHAPEASEGTKQALTSLTFNAGDKWTRSGLGEAVKAGDTDKVKEIFLQYNKAGGEVLPGLARRRLAEAAWIGAPSAEAAAPGLPPAMTATATQTAPTPPMVAAAAVADLHMSPPPPVQTSPEAQLTALLTAEESEDALVAQIRGAVSGMPGEARMAQLLLASEFLGAPSAAEPDETQQAGSRKELGA